METEGTWQRAERLRAATVRGDPFAAAVRATRMPIVITDPRQEDNPIVFANGAFLKLTGYDRDEIIGKNCRFLQGPATDPYAVGRIRTAVREARDIHVDLLNYRKDGTTFWNELYLSPIVDELGELSFFFASQLDVSARKAAEFEIQAAHDHFERMSKERTGAIVKLHEADRRLNQALHTQQALRRDVDHRMKYTLRMVSSLILAQANATSDGAVRRSLWHMLVRIEALAAVSPRLCSDDGTRFDVGPFVRDLVTALIGSEARGAVRPVFDLHPTTAAVDQAVPVALVVGEVVATTLKNTLPDPEQGTLTITVNRSDRLRISICGTGLCETPVANSERPARSPLIDTLSRQSNAEVVWAGYGAGERVTIEFPMA